jgi:hypothetical protein
MERVRQPFKLPTFISKVFVWIASPFPFRRSINLAEWKSEQNNRKAKKFYDNVQNNHRDC